MTSSGQANHELHALKERNSLLCSAILRTNASLDLDTVLREAVDAARGLTGARLGMIVTVDEAGATDGFLESGFTSAETAELAAWPDRERLFEHLRELSATLRVEDLAAYAGDLGLTPAPALSHAFQGTPMHYRGVDVGSFFLADKTRTGAFTEEDEELLALFASQAAAAIVNARAHRDEQRARADLEALVETSPMGVAVCDAKSGRVVSANRELRRIVARLIAPDVGPIEAMKALTIRFANGHEVALEALPLARVLGDARTMRAEEVEISVPDGRSLRTLVNVTPIRDEDNEVVSVVVTMQDLGPLEELERLRSEFLGMVSHELRAPLAAIKGSAAAVLGASPALPRAEVLQFFRIVDGQADHMQGLIGNLLDAGRIEAGTLSVDPEASEVIALADAAKNAFVSGGGRHAVVIDLPGKLPAVMADRERIVQVLKNLLSNAARHSPESSPIRIEAAREDGHVAVAVCDKGRGVPPEMLGQLFRKHVALDGGRAAEGMGPSGLGLSICKGLVEAHGGRIRAESPGLGHGARFTFTLPVAEGAAAPAQRARRRARLSGASGERPPVLVVDDDPQTLRLVRRALAGAGYGVIETGEPEQVAELIRVEKPGLVLLDLVFPGIDGIELMEQVPELSDLPVIFISAYGRDETIARAFENGAEDYVVKPFSATELLARVAAALRRRTGAEPFVHGELMIDYERRRVSVGQRAVALTATEYDLLRILALDAGRVVTSASLLRQLWGTRDSADTEPVRAFVKKLRGKLGDSAANPTWIFNVRGVGYRMSRPGDGGAADVER
ncbi:MAG: response regulator [Rhodospirillaceae bacterium]|nr:response regulator [Rhodospirillaceae bacterium]